MDTAPAASVRADTNATRPDTVAWYPEDDGYIGPRLKDAFGSAPGIAWVVPPHRLITARRYATPRTLGAQGVESWTYRGTIATDSAMRLRRAQHIACESQSPLYEYSGEGPALQYAERVFLIDSGTADIKAGFMSVAPDSSWLVGALAKLLGNHRDRAHRDTAAGAARGDEFYSFHGVYDTSASADAENGTKGVKYLVSRGLVLHAVNGAVIASHVSDVPAVECDGSGTPTLTDDFGAVFSFLQVLRLPGFPHPLLLLDTGTVEGRALSLATFDEAGAYHTYRVYEYVVNCF